MAIPNKNFIKELQNIPMNYIAQDLRVKEYLQRKEMQIRKECQGYFKDYHFVVEKLMPLPLTISPSKNVYKTLYSELSINLI